MKIRILLTTTILFLAAASALAGWGDHHRNRGLSVSMDFEAATGCEAIRIESEDGVALRDTRELTLAAGGEKSIEASTNGSIRVIGWDRPDYLVSACLAAAGEDQTDARQQLDAIRVESTGERVTADGPDRGDWMVFFIVRAPRDARMDLTAVNGGVSLVDVNGTIEARSTNGPISIRNSTGRINARTTNGPVTLNGTRGTFDLKTQNGPINFRPDGSSWDEGTVSMATRNGPVSLRLPEGYRSAITVESSHHSPLHCDSEICRHTIADLTKDRSITLGEGTSNIRMSTVNGPVTISAR